MRIVLSNSSRKWGGVHVITESLAAGLRSRGHDVVLFSRPGSELSRRLHDVVPQQTLVSGADLNPSAIIRCAGALRRHRSDIVLALMDKDLRITGVAARALGIPSVVRRANDRPLKDAFQRFFYTRVARRVVANSMATRDTLLSSTPALAARGVDVILNGIDVERFRSAVPARLDVPEGAVVFGFAGRFEARKGLFDLADAWHSVEEQVPNAYLVIAGRGPIQDTLHERFADRDRVRFIGYRTDIAEVMRAIDVLVMPSHWEGFGLSAVEAMAAGRPVIATSVSSLTELVRDGINGRLVPTADPMSLAHAMIDLARDPDHREALGRSGAEIATRSFDVRRMVDEWEALLRETIDGSRDTPREN